MGVVAGRYSSDNKSGICDNATHRRNYPVDSGRVIVHPVLRWQSSFRCTSVLWTESFIFAGASAFLLLIAQLFPGYWYLSFIALIPLLARAYRASAMEALRLGFLLGFTFFLISGLNTLPVSPFLSIAKILAGIALFAAFGWAVGWTRQRWGFNPMIVALIWVAFESCLIKLGVVGSLLGEAGVSGSFLHGLSALFGFLIISFIVVFCNSLIIAAIDKAIAMARAWAFEISVGERTWDLYFTAGLFAQKFYLVPEGRGPPSR